MDSFNEVFDSIMGESTRLISEKEKVESKGIQKFGDVKFNSKISSEVFDDDTNVYHDFKLTAPKKDVPLRMNWVKELNVNGTIGALKTINSEIKMLEKDAVKPLQKSLDIVNKRIADLKSARDGINAEDEKLKGIEGKYK